MKVLIVEDEEDIREVISEFLTIMNAEYDTAANGKEAFEAIKSSSYDMILTDLKLPDVYGIEIVKKVREQDSEIFIVVISGYTEKETKEKVFNAGANYYIEKPFSFTEISKIIDLVK